MIIIIIILLITVGEEGGKGDLGEGVKVYVQGRKV
jgi:hypothetical protein